MVYGNESLDNIINKFIRSKDFAEIEKLADRLGEMGNDKSIEPLISRLGDYFTKKDGDIEDAICSSLVKLGVMKKTGINLMFEFLENQFLSNEAIDIINKYKRDIPTKYFKENKTEYTGEIITKGVKKVIIDAILKTAPVTIIYSCPYCCTGDEGIKGQIPPQIEKDFFDSLRKDLGCQTPCPNCGKILLLKADKLTIKELGSFD